MNIIKQQMSFVYRDLRMAIRNYRFSFSKSKTIVIYSMDDRGGFTNGFADRLRGMISSYAYAKAINHPFKIDHIEPFVLYKFFEPNKVNWILCKGEKREVFPFSLPVVIIDYESGERVPFIPRFLQIHFFTNVDFIPEINKHFKTNYTYQQLFKELFKPSKYLLESLQMYLPLVKIGYISISFRFMQLMGDLKDVRGNVLSVNEREELICKCLRFIESLHNKYSNYKYVLITADSKLLIERVVDLPYVFTISGEIGHIGFMKNDAIFLKTIQDFYMISQAKMAFLGYTGEMYKSNFAREAAKTTGIPFETIEF